MKTKLITEILFLFACLLIFNAVTFAQTKVDEYNEEKVNLSLLEEKATNFAEKLLAEPSTTTGFITIYENSKEAEKIKSILFKKPQLKNRIEFLTPGIRYMMLPNNSEFWLIPWGAEAPYKPTCSLCVCPEIKISGVESVNNQISFLTFTANVSGGSADTVTYNWKISAGKIIEGQGTPAIKVDSESAKEVIATVEIDDVCEECLRETSFTTKIQ